MDPTVEGYGCVERVVLDKELLLQMCRARRLRVFFSDAQSLISKTPYMVLKVFSPHLEQV